MLGGPAARVIPVPGSVGTAMMRTRVAAAAVPAGAVRVARIARRRRAMRVMSAVGERVGPAALPAVGLAGPVVVEIQLCAGGAAERRDEGEAKAERQGAVGTRGHGVSVAIWTARQRRRGRGNSPRPP